MEFNKINTSTSKILKIKIIIFILMHLILHTVQAKSGDSLLLNIGSPAPPLQVHEWLKGKPISEFKKGKVYVIEFWATWCGPCIEEMPRLSQLRRKYKNSLSIIGVNIYDRKPLPSVRAFVDSMANWMNYTVAVQDSNFMEITWMKAAAESSIPTCFVIDATGKIAWIGHTSELPGILPKVIERKWDMKEASAERDSNKIHETLKEELIVNVLKYTDNRYMTDFFGEPDSAILTINNFTEKHPGSKHDYFINRSMLRALLRKDPKKAYEFGKDLLSNKNPSYDAVINSIRDFPYQYNTLPPQIFELGAEACQGKINLYPYTAKTPSNYFTMADWYLRAGNNEMARKAMKKAVKALKSKKKPFVTRLL